MWCNMYKMNLKLRCPVHCMRVLLLFTLCKADSDVSLDFVWFSFDILSRFVHFCLYYNFVCFIFSEYL